MQISNPVKAIIGLVVAFGLTIVGARLAFDASTADPTQGAAAPWDQDRMEFVAWNSQRWTGWVRDGQFELTPATEGTWHRHANTTIAYVGWDGDLWQARVKEGGFEIAHRGEWHGTVEMADALRYRDWSGERRLRTLAQISR